ncbi:MAG TPA: TonB family protein [Pyrinomonadaceae bacterium]|nr:TonB family protein [Pyrinomonadaceae bacterium]
MKPRFIFLAVFICLTGCSLFVGPTTTARKFMDAANAGDVEAMNQLFSKRAIQRDGLEKIRSNNQQFADMSQRSASSGPYKMNNIQETKVGNDARVGFHYQNEDKTDSVRFVFALSKEDGAWKIDNIGGSALEDEPDITSSVVKDPPPEEEPTPSAPEPEPVPSLDLKPGPPSAPTPPRAPISGGVLNGKATSLPKPVYPPIAKAAKASGTVTVQVTIDENGNVISTSAISGHPLLRASAVAAARAAKFTPTKLAGQPVKVTGVITYNFVTE